MKKILNEYLKILSYAIIGIVFGLSSFILIINFYHYKEVNTVFVKSDSDNSIKDEINTKITNISTNANTFNINNYSGNEDKYSLLSVQNRLNVCVNKINTPYLTEILNKSNITISDVYEMQQFYQINISNECLIKELYELTILNNEASGNIKSLSQLAPFIEDNINNLKDSTEYVKKVIKNNSSYYYVSDTSRTTLYNEVEDSYYSIMNDYIAAINFVEDISIWYKNVVGG